MHLVNVFFHIAAVLLLFLILDCTTGALWRSAFVAALFALHPLHVESVAWIAERKDVLSAFFWMLTLGAYVLYVEKQRPGRYLAALFFFALGLMAKPMLVTLPFVLLLLDFWPLNRLRAGESVRRRSFEPAEKITKKEKSRTKRKAKEHDVKPLPVAGQIGDADGRPVHLRELPLRRFFHIPAGPPLTTGRSCFIQAHLPNIPQ